MKIIIPGGSGHVGKFLSRSLKQRGHEVKVLSRSADPGDPDAVVWDGRTPDDWCRSFEGADVVINLAGKNVNCRYNPVNRRKIIDSRIESTRVVGEAIAAAKDPPAVWLQMSTATIYRHTFDTPNDEEHGVIGGNEAGAPDAWRFSIDVATRWERTALEANVGKTRMVLMRSAIVFSPDRNGPFDLLMGLVRKGVGGTSGDGRQMVSWVHETDFVNSVLLLMEDDRLSGPVNIASPNPLPNREFMRILRETWGMPVGIPSPRWLLGVAAFVMRTETELILKSRYVIPGKLEAAGFEFEFPDWSGAAGDLCERWRRDRRK